MRGTPLLLAAALGCASSGPPVPPPDGIVLRDGARGLEVVSAPTSLTLPVGHIAYLPVAIQGYRRPVRISATMPIQTFVNDVTAADPEIAAAREAGTISGASGEIRLQTLRLYRHDIVLSFDTDGGAQPAVVSLALIVSLPARGVLFGSDPGGQATLPFIDVYGPDCTPCGTPLTEDRKCYAMVRDPGRCRPWGTRRDEARVPQALAEARRAQRLAVQVVRDGPTDQNHIFLDAERFDWTVTDWFFGELKPAVGGPASIAWQLLPGAPWMSTCGAPCQNPNGSQGLFDADNDYLMGKLASFARNLAARHAGRIRFYEIVNEPAAEFWLCGCSRDGRYDPAVCLDNRAAAGPNLPVCWWSSDPVTGEPTGGPYAEAFVSVYGDLLRRTFDLVAREIGAADPGAVVISGELDTPNTGAQRLSPVTRHLIRRGLFRDHPNLALGIHEYPSADPALWIPGIACAYAGAFNYDLPEGCETAPPLEGELHPKPDKTVPVRAVWRKQDEDADLSELLREIGTLERDGAPVRLDDLRLFDTELHIGFHETYGGHTSALTSPAREAMAGLRTAAILAHQGFIGVEFIFAPEDPAVFNAMVKQLSGSVPVYRFAAPRTGAAYNGVVYKLFSRGAEDIIAYWSNADRASSLALSLAGPGARYHDVRQVRIAAAPGGAAILEAGTYDGPPASLPVAPVAEFHFLSVISDRPGFAWLDGVTADP